MVCVLKRSMSSTKKSVHDTVEQVNFTGNSISQIFNFINFAEGPNLQN